MSGAANCKVNNFYRVAAARVAACGQRPHQSFTLLQCFSKSVSKLLIISNPVYFTGSFAQVAQPLLIGLSNLTDLIDGPLAEDVPTLCQCNEGVLLAGEVCHRASVCGDGQTCCLVVLPLTRFGRQVHCEDIPTLHVNSKNALTGGGVVLTYPT